MIDLYQIHWPERHVPAFGTMYFDPSKDKTETSIHEQLEAMAQLVKTGKVRYIGLSNETPYGIHEFMRLSEQHGLPRVMTVQNPYCLTNRTFDELRDRERQKVELWARATRELVRPSSDDIDFTFVLDITKENTDIPVILLDNNNKLLSSKNLNFDAERLSEIFPNRNEDELMQKYSDSVTRLALIWAKTHEPIPIEITTNWVQYVGTW